MRTKTQLEADVRLYEGQMDYCDDHNDPAGYARAQRLYEEAYNELQRLEAANGEV